MKCARNRISGWLVIDKTIEQWETLHDILAERKPFLPKAAVLIGKMSGGSVGT
jgi:hypothetical protein